VTTDLRVPLSRVAPGACLGLRPPGEGSTYLRCARKRADEKGYVLIASLKSGAAFIYPDHKTVYPMDCVYEERSRLPSTRHFQTVTPGHGLTAEVPGRGADDFLRIRAGNTAAEADLGLLPKAVCLGDGAVYTFHNELPVYPAVFRYAEREGSVFVPAADTGELLEGHTRCTHCQYVHLVPPSGNNTYPCPSCGRSLPSRWTGERLAMLSRWNLRKIAMTCGFPHKESLKAKSDEMIAFVLNS
jgi:hypothetical protein